MGMPIGIDAPRRARRRRRAGVRLAAGGRRDLQHLPRRQRDQPAGPRRADARRLPPRGRRGADAVPRPRARHERLLLRPPRRPPRPVRPRQGLGRRRRRASGSPRRAPGTSASTPAATSSRAAGPRRTAAGASASATPTEPDRLAAVLAVEDLAVATSGEYERGAHIVDPHTGEPPTGPAVGHGRRPGPRPRPTPTRPPRSPWAPTARPGRRPSPATTRCASRATTASCRRRASPATASDRAETDPEQSVPVGRPSRRLACDL